MLSKDFTLTLLLEKGLFQQAAEEKFNTRSKSPAEMSPINSVMGMGILHEV